ncbi:MAG: DUF4198 domain-containing protein [Deltaproteobacteria bacterium]|jgi:uncharacterized GH25 family protein|nr:DUF4198 domain-containing protein [Deltaproteobacteria bacterium]
MYKIYACLIALALLMATPAMAHDMWATADKPEAGKPLAMVIGYGHHFPQPEAIPDEEYGLFNAKLFGPKGEIALTPGTPNYIWNSNEPVEAGTYLAISDVNPVFWSQTPEGWAMKPKNEAPGAISCGRFIESAKGIVNVGAPGNPEILATKVGLPIEIIPSVNPATVKPGQKLPLTVLLQGQPLAGAIIKARNAGFQEIAESPEASAFSSVTDRNGLVNFVPLAEGDWILSASYETPYQDLAACDKESYATTLFFNIAK